MEQFSDTKLIELARAGDQSAFAELYSRYFDPVYDFAARMTRNRDDAADIAQDTFLKAMNALGGLQKGASFKSWIFTIARNTALNRLERNKRTRPLSFEDDEGEEVSFEVVDTDRFADPVRAAEAEAAASLVWQAAAGLDPMQLSLLDLHLRQGLDSGEIADVLGVTKNNGYVMLNRLKKAVEEAIGAFIMLHDGRRYCETLDLALSRAGIAEMTADVRKLIDAHVAECDACEERRRKLVAPLAVFGAFAAVGSPAGLKPQVLEGLMRQWPGPASGPGGPAGGSGSGGANAGRWSSKNLLKAVAGLGIAAALLLGAVLVPASPLAITKHDGKDSLAAAAGSDDTPTPSPTNGGSNPTSTSAPFGGGGNSPGGGGGSPSPASSAGPSVSATPKSTSEALAGATTPANTETSTPAATATPVPPTSNPTQTPTTIPTATATGTPTPIVVPTSTPPPCNPSAAVNVDVVNVTGGSNTFQLRNTAVCGALDFQVSFSATWIAAVGPKSGTLPAFGTADITIQAEATTLGEGLFDAPITVAWAGGSTQVMARVDHPGTAPVISAVTARCTPSSSADSFRATVFDDYAVKSVTVGFTRPDGTTGTLAMTNTSGSAYAADGTGPMKTWSITASDFGGHQATQSGSCG